MTSDRASGELEVSWAMCCRTVNGVRCVRWWRRVQETGKGTSVPAQEHRSTGEGGAVGRCLIQGHVRGGAGGTGAGALPTASALHTLTARTAPAEPNLLSTTASASCRFSLASLAPQKWQTGVQEATRCELNACEQAPILRLRVQHYTAVFSTTSSTSTCRRDQGSGGGLNNCARNVCGLKPSSTAHLIDCAFIQSQFCAAERIQACHAQMHRRSDLPFLTGVHHA